MGKKHKPKKSPPRAPQQRPAGQQDARPKPKDNSAATENPLAGLKDDSQERLESVQSFWSTASEQTRRDLLTLPVSELMEEARSQAEAHEVFIRASENEKDGHKREMFKSFVAMLRPTALESLQLCLDRKRAGKAWKVWKWPRNGQEFSDIPSYRKFLREEAIDSYLRDSFPLTSGTPENPGLKRLRQRMTRLVELTRESRRSIVEEYHRKGDQDHVSYGDLLDHKDLDCPCKAGHASTDMADILMVVMDLSNETLALYEFLVASVIKCVNVPSDQTRQTPGHDHTLVDYSRLDSLPPDEIQSISMWLRRSVSALRFNVLWDNLSIIEDDEKDMFSLVDDPEKGECLIINPEWMHYLLDHTMDDDGPRTKQEGEDHNSPGLELMWLYGNLPRLPDYDRQAAKAPDSLALAPEHTIRSLLDALDDQQMWEERYAEDRGSIRRMLATQATVAEVVAETPYMYDLNAVPESFEQSYDGRHKLSNGAIVYMLTRELLGMNARKRDCQFQTVLMHQKLRVAKNKAAQAEFVMRGTKVELDEMREILKGKQDPSETPRQEAARIAENERRLRHKTESTAELDECLRDSVGSVKMYKEQISDIHTLLRKLEEAIKRFGRMVKFFVQLEAGGIADEAIVTTTRRHFIMDVRPRLMSESAHKEILQRTIKKAKAEEIYLEDGQAVIDILEKRLINSTCEDTGQRLTQLFLFPRFQKRIEAAAKRAADESFLNLKAIHGSKHKAKGERRPAAQAREEEALSTPEEDASAEQVEPDPPATLNNTRLEESTAGGDHEVEDKKEAVSCIAPVETGDDATDLAGSSQPLSRHKETVKSSTPPVTAASSRTEGYAPPGKGSRSDSRLGRSAQGMTSTAKLVRPKPPTLESALAKLRTCS